MYTAIFVVSLIVVIMFHEFGHYATAKAFGMKVEKFFLGFGPTLWSFRRGETEYGVKAIPAGGFVKIIGMTHVEEIDPADQGRTFFEQPGWQRAIVLCAGSATHFVVAAILIFVALAFVGYVSGVSTAIDEVTEGSPAASAGLRAGDTIVAVDGRPTAEFVDVREAVGARPGQELHITVERAGERLEVPVTASAVADPETGEERGFLGVRPSPIIQRASVGQALAGTVTGDFALPRITVLSLQGLYRAFTPDSIRAWLGQLEPGAERVDEGLTSLVGAAQVVGELGRQGDVFLVLLLLAQLNVVLGTLNMLPLPPLDGGHFAVLLTEEGVNGVRRLRGRQGRWRIDPYRLTPIALAVIIFFVVVSLTAMYIDIIRPASELLQ
jgi:membrane-associated protease RseP (regulator of RpoE activity)